MFTLILFVSVVLMPCFLSLFSGEYHYCFASLSAPRLIPTPQRGLLVRLVRCLCSLSENGMRIYLLCAPSHPAPAWRAWRARSLRPCSHPPMSSYSSSPSPLPLPFNPALFFPLDRPPPLLLVFLLLLFPSFASVLYNDLDD